MMHLATARAAATRPLAMAMARPLVRPVIVSVQRCAFHAATPLRAAPDDLHSAAAEATYIAPAQVEERVMGVIKDFEKVEPGKVTNASHFIDDLGLDSLDTVELVMAFEEEFMVEMDDAQAEKIFTVSDAVTFFSQHPKAK